MRVTLPDGKWAELRPWLTHGERKAVLRAILASDRDAELGPEVNSALVRAYLAEWNVTGRDGHELAVTELDAAPSELVTAIATAALALWTARADPNASGGT